MFKELLNRGLTIGSSVNIGLDEASRDYLSDNGVGDLRQAFVWGACADASGTPDGNLKMLVRSHKEYALSGWTDITLDSGSVKTMCNIGLDDLSLATLVVRSRFGNEASSDAIESLIKQMAVDRRKLDQLQENQA